ncbi:MAG: diguanylate cyclase [Burkholderiaceae bacterium]
MIAAVAPSRRRTARSIMVAPVPVNDKHPALRPTARRGLWFSATLALLVIIGVSAWVSFQRPEQDENELFRAYEVTRLLQAVAADMKGVESSQRGYLITGRDDALVPYGVALLRITENHARLARLLGDRPAQRERLEALRQEVDRRVRRASAIIGVYRAEGEAAALALVRRGSGEPEVDLVRSGVDELVAEEHRLLKQRQRDEDQASIHAGLTGLAGMTACVLVLLSVFLSMQRENRLRSRVQQSLEQSITAMRAISAENAAIALLGDRLRSCQRLDEALVMSARAIPGTLPNTAGAIALFDSGHGQLETVSRWGAIGESAASFETGPCSALRHGLPDLPAAEGLGPVCTPVGEPCGRATLCVPLQAHGETIGMMTVTAPAATPPEQRLVRRVAEQVSLAVSSLRLHDHLWQQAVRDPLTELFNRRYLGPMLDREIARASREAHPVSLLMIDIDHFKRINDEHGHDGGDAFLRRFAELIRDGVRQDDIVCRYGGEEFVVVLPRCSLEMALERAEDLRKAVAGMRVPIGKGRSLSATTSIGVAALPGHADSGAALISAADLAMYRAKNGGRNRTVTADQLPDAAAVRPASREALDRRCEAGRPSREVTGQALVAMA